MVKIDGSVVRELRESKGLTQLYLATAVDVTTDTISRWENRRYPKIKRENALKLAEILEVSLDDILDHHEGAASKLSEIDAGSTVSKVEITKDSVEHTKRFFLIYLAVAAAFCLVGSWWWFGSSDNKIKMTAARIIPDHTVPGYPFPVVIRVDIDKVPSSFILKEKIPEDCTLVGDSLSGVVVDEKSSTLKWIIKAKNRATNIGYMLKSMPSLGEGENLNFAGSITQRKTRGKGRETSGLELVTISLYHWADSDQNGIIDDEEILTVYDDYNETDGLNFNMDLIEEIWFGSGYQWDKTSGKFTVLP